MAKNYALPNGYVYSATMNFKNKIISDNMKPNLNLLNKLISLCDEERKIIGLSNFAENPIEAKRIALSFYMGLDFIDACLNIYHDFYGPGRANEWTEAMVKIGFDAYWRPEKRYLIIYNPSIINVIEEKSVKSYGNKMI